MKWRGKKRGKKHVTNYDEVDQIMQLMAMPDVLIPKKKPEADGLKICLTGDRQGIFYLDALIEAGRPARFVPPESNQLSTTMSAASLCESP